MSKYTIDSSTLTDIAEAIRTKTGSVSQMTPLEMPTEIGTIPTYENGDSESYPKVSIPSGTERTYSEQTISDIADAINTKAGTSGIMTPSAMITAIGNIPSGGSGGGGITEDILIKNNIKALTRQVSGTERLAGIVYYPNTDYFYIMPSTGPVTIGFIFNGTHDNGFFIGSIRYYADNGRLYHVNNIESQTSGVSVTGIEIPNIEINDDAPTPGDFTVAISTFETSNHPLYSTGSQIYDLSPSSHPVAINMWGNNKLTSLKSEILNIDASDIFQVTNVPGNFDLDDITQGIIFIGSNGHLVVDCGVATSPYIRVDSNEKLQAVAGTNTHYWGRIESFSTLRYTLKNVTLYENNASEIDYANNTPASGLIYSTYDILDYNGEVYYPANMTLDQFKSLFHVS